MHKDGQLVTALNKHGSKPLVDYFNAGRKCSALDTLDKCKADKDCAYTSTHCTTNPTKPHPLESWSMGSLLNGCQLEGTPYEYYSVQCQFAQPLSESGCTS